MRRFWAGPLSGALVARMQAPVLKECMHQDRVSDVTHDSRLPVAASGLFDIICLPARFGATSFTRLSPSRRIAAVSVARGPSGDDSGSM